MSTSTILGEIIAERVYQDEVWGHHVDDTSNTPWMWSSYIAQYATKWMQGYFAPLPKGNVDDFRGKMVKVAALAIAAIESVDRQRQDEAHCFFEQNR